MNNFIVAGIGGQGIITCSKLILETALEKGYEVRSTETIGMAQRGGSVLSHVRIGKNVYSPFIPKGMVDEIISMDYKEAIRYQSHLKLSGTIETIIDDKIQNYNFPVCLRQDINVKCYEIEKAWKEIGSKKSVNIILLGIVFSDDRYAITHKDIEETITRRFNGEIRQMNLEALNLGVFIGQKGSY